MDKIVLTHNNLSEVYTLKKDEITKINDWLAGIIYYEKYDMIADRTYWKKKYFILTESTFELISRHNKKKRRRYKLSNLKVSGLCGDGNLVFFYIYKKNRKKSMVKLTTPNTDGLLQLYRELLLNIKYC